jgi:hypothetical protein
MIKVIYVFDHCCIQSNNSYFFTFVFDNLSLEVMNILIMISQNYSCIVLKKTEKSKLNIDFEYGFQLNGIANHTKLNSSTLCLLMATNPRYEGYYLNLKLRRRFLKGNFKCLAVGSLINLTFPISFLGSNFNIIKSITEGNNFICQDLKFSTNPFLIYNNEFFKRNDGSNTNETLKMLLYSNMFNKVWNGLNKLSSSLSGTGILTLKQIPHIRLKDLNNFSSLYLINTTTNNVSNLKKITALKLLKKMSLHSQRLLTYKLLVDQNQKTNNNKITLHDILINYVYVPNGTFYGNEETFINTEGFVKRSTKLIQRKQTRNGWQILRKFLHHCKTKLTFLTQKENRIVFFSSKKFYNFKNFLTFQYSAIQSVTHLNFYLTIKNKPIVLHLFNFKPKTKKVINTKLKYWLDDFFNGGKDEYSQYSKILRQCSKNLRSEFSNFQNL